MEEIIYRLYLENIYLYVLLLIDKYQMRDILAAEFETACFKPR